MVKSRRPPSWVAFAPDEWRGGVENLNPIQEFVYFRACLIMWDTGKPVARTEMHDSLKLGEAEIDEALAALVLKGKLEKRKRGTAFANKRALGAYKDAQDRRKAGARGGHSKWGTSPSRASADQQREYRKKRAERMRRARELGTHTVEEWNALITACGNKCVRCGQAGCELVKDHIVPVYQGGSDGLGNLQPLCRRCNAAKGPEATDHRPGGWEARLNASGVYLAGYQANIRQLQNSTVQKNPPPVVPPQGDEEEAEHIESDASPAALQFTTWFEHYPRKRAMGKAREAYKKALRKTDAGTLLAGAQRYAKAVNGKASQFMLSPENWLDGEHWHDEPDKEQGGDRPWNKVPI